MLVVPVVLLVMFVFPPGSAHCPALAPVKRRGIIVGRQILVRLTVRQQTGNSGDMMALDETGDMLADCNAGDEIRLCPSGQARPAGLERTDNILSPLI